MTVENFSIRFHTSRVDSLVDTGLTFVICVPSFDSLVVYTGSSFFVKEVTSFLYMSVVVMDAFVYLVFVSSLLKNIRIITFQTFVNILVSRFS